MPFFHTPDFRRNLDLYLGRKVVVDYPDARAELRNYHHHRKHLLPPHRAFRSLTDPCRHSIQYAGGTNVNATFAGDTRTLIADNLKTQLVNAGWTAAGGSPDWTLTSATTPQSLACKVRINDPGGGGGATRTRISFRNTGATIIGQDLFLAPAAARVYTVIANKYQFVVLVKGLILTSATFVMGGVPFLEAFLNGVITECIWGQGNAQDDGDVANNTNSFRRRLSGSIASGGTTKILNGNLVNDDGSSVGGMQLTGAYGSMVSTAAPSTVSGRKWHSDEVIKMEPLIAWGSPVVTDEAKIRGQLWDGVVVVSDYPVDINTGDANLDAFDGHNWWNITSSNVGGAAYYPGSLFLVIP